VAWLPPRFTLHMRWLVFGGILLAGSVLVITASDVTTMTVALAILGIGVGPTLVTLYSLGAARSPLGRSATVMTMLGAGVVVGQAAAAAITGELAEGSGTGAALIMPLIAAAIVVATGIANRLMTPARR
jgi:MFS family permease